MSSISDDDEDLIYKLACDCEGLLDALQSEIPEAKQHITVASLFTDYQQRFATWAAYTGVFARRSRSLDKKLRNVPDIKDLVVRLLDILRGALNQLLEAQNSQRSFSNISHQIEAISEDEKMQERPSRLDMEVMEAVEEALTRLNRLGLMIRLSSRTGISARVKRFATGLDMESFENLSSFSIQCLYPNADQALKDHLSKSMAEQYATILYMQSRQSALRSRRTNSPRRMVVINESDELGINLPPDLLGTQVSSMASTPMSTMVPRGKSTASESDISSLNTALLRGMLNRPQRPGLHIHKTSSIQINQGNYPPTPTKQDANITTCEWCSEPLAKEELEGSNWRRHVDRDLKPYICLWRDCKGEFSRYETFDGWFKHMQEHNQHWAQEIFKPACWVCSICSDEQNVYDDSQALFVHMQRTHTGEFTIDQLQTISRQCKAQLQRPRGECPLCCFDIKTSPPLRQSVSLKRQKEPSHESIKSPRTAASMRNPEHRRASNDFSTDSDTDIADKSMLTKTIGRHVASHLQMLMLLTLRLMYLQNGEETSIDEGKSDEGDVDTDTGSTRDQVIAVAIDTDMEEGSVHDSDDNDGDGDSGGRESRKTPPESTIWDHETYIDWGDVTPYADFPVEDDEFLREVIKSGAYQSHSAGSPQTATSPGPPLTKPASADSDIQELHPEQLATSTAPVPEQGPTSVNQRISRNFRSSRISALIDGFRGGIANSGKGTKENGSGSITETPLPMTNSSDITDLSDSHLICSNFFGPNNRVNCCIPVDGGRMLIYGTDNGIYTSDAESKNTLSIPKLVIEVQKVTNIEALEEYELLLVLSGRSLLWFPLSSLDSEEPISTKYGKKIQSNCTFFKTGTSMDRQLICCLKATSLTTTVKLFKPSDVMVDIKRREGFGNLFGRSQDSIQPFKEFYIPRESSSVYFLRSKLCITCASGFEVVSLETLETQSMLDRADLSLDLVKKKGLKPVHLERINGEFLINYSGVSFFINRNGWRCKPEWKIDWQGSPQAFAVPYPWIMAFEPNFIELRNIELNDARILFHKNIRMLHCNNQEVLFAYENLQGNDVIELLDFRKSSLD